MMMKQHATVFVPVFVLAWLWGGPCPAVIIFEKGSDEPTRGYLVSENEFRVIVDELLPNGETKQRILPRTAIEEVIVTVSRERLEGLRRDHPKDYRDYAEELAVKAEDPDARATAIRLYLIAAYLDPESLGRSCLLGITGLARSPAQERRFRAMAYLLDPDHDRSVLRPPSMKTVPSDQVSDAARQACLKALRLLRSGKGGEASNMARRPMVEGVLKRFSHVLSKEEFAAAARRDAALSPETLRKILTLELTLSNAPPPIEAEDTKPDLTAWSQILSRGRDQPVAELALETLAEFDPRQCEYRDGKWVEPEK